MKSPALILSLLLACSIAGCAAPKAGGMTSAGGQYNYASGACYDPGMGTGYARDYSYGDRYLSGHNRQC